MAQQREYIKISGSVEDVIFKNEETGFCVLDLDIGGELVCAVGAMGAVEAGEELELTGYYETHSVHGTQFRVQMCERRLPATSGAIRRYLASGVVKGIGPATAKRIVDRFGDDTLRVIEEDPMRLAEVQGISRAKAEKMAESFKQVFGVRSLMLFLSQHGIDPVKSVAVYKKWGASAMERIRENPYILSLSEIGVPFSVSDSIADTLSLPKDAPERVSAGLRYVLSHNTSNGHTALPRRLLLPTAAKLLNLEEETVENVLDDGLLNGDFYTMTENTPLIFLPEYYTAQQYITGRINVMLSVYSEKPQGVDAAIDLIEREKRIHYADLQRKAIAQAAEHALFILTGGPGTGKTTTLNGIIEVLEQQGKRVALAAPTGRAAKRMAEVTGREAKTIHRLLEVAVGYAKSGKLEFVHNEQDPIDADAVIVDEVSMVDTLLFDALLRGMKPAAKLILVGDFHQLPSVGAGNILRDLIESDTVPTVELNQIFRQAAKSLIVTNAHEIVQGHMPELLRKDNDFFFLPQSDPHAAQRLILDLCERRLPASYGFSPTEDIQVLCPQRKGDLGVIELNSLLQERLNPKAEGKTEFKGGVYTFRVADKVMQIRNNYDIPWTRGEESGAGIFNGDIGIIRMIDRGSKTIAIEFDGRTAYYTFDMTEELELAYAVTVHKSQGSEFEAIILPVMGGYDKLYFRNLLYTAVTRAKKILILVGQRGRIQFMVQNDKKMLRYTGLKTMLQESILG